MANSLPYSPNDPNQAAMAMEMPFVFIKKITLEEAYVTPDTIDPQTGDWIEGESTGINAKLDIHIIPSFDQRRCSCLNHPTLNKYVNIVIKETVGDTQRFIRKSIPNVADSAAGMDLDGYIYMSVDRYIPYKQPTDPQTGDPLRIQGVMVYQDPSFVEYTAWLEIDISAVSNELMEMGAPTMNNIIGEMKHKVPLFPESDRPRGGDFETDVWVPPRGLQGSHKHSISSLGGGGGMTNYRLADGRTEDSGRGRSSSFDYIHNHSFQRGIISPPSAGADHSHNLVGTLIVDTRGLLRANWAGITSEDNEELECQYTAPTQRNQDVKIPEIQTKTSQTNMFSQIYFSRDPFENNRFFFSMDMKEILKTYSIVGKIFKKDSSYSRILRNSPPYIPSLRIYRKRVGGTSLFKRHDSLYEGATTIFGSKLEINSFGSSLDPTSHFSELMVVGSAQSPTATELTAIKNPLNYTPSMIGCSIEEKTNMFKGKSVSNLRHFSGVDATIKDQYDGYYQYRVELRIHDPGFSLLQKDLKSLKASHKIFLQYLADISFAPRPVKNPFPDPHLDPFGSYVDIEKNIKINMYDRLGVEISRRNSDDPNPIGYGDKKVFRREFVKTLLPPRRYERNEYVPGHFDLVQNSFSQVYNSVESAWVNPNDPNGLGDELALALRNYLQIASFFTETKIDYEKEFKKFAAVISAKSGSPQGIKSVIKFIELLILNIENTLSKSPLLEKISDGSSTSPVRKNNFKSSTLQNPTVISVSHTFSDLYNSGLPAKTGFDFLTLPNETNFGLKTVSRVQIKSIVDNEKKKIFKTSNVDLSLGETFRGFQDTSWSFFTPSMIDVTTKVSIDLRPKDGIPCFGCEDAFNDVGKISFFANTETGISTNKSSFEKFAGFGDVRPRLGLTETSFDVSSMPLSLTETSFGTQDFGKPLNTFEEATLSTNGSIAGEINTSFKMSEFLSVNSGVTVEVDSLQTAPLSTADTMTTNVSAVEVNTSQVNLGTQNSQVNLGTQNMSNALSQNTAQMSARVGSNFMMNLVSKINPELAFPQVSYFNLSNPSSPIKKSLDCCADRGESTNNILSGAPNQIKALFRFNEPGFSIATTDPFRGDITQFLSTNIGGSNRDTFRYKFQTINVLECLVEFDSTKSKICKGSVATPSPQLNMPVWKKLTPEILNDTKGVNLLCKLSPYRNSSLGLIRNKSYDLPTYDEVFILKGD